MANRTLIYNTYSHSATKSRLKKRVSLKELLRELGEKLLIALLLIGTFLSACGVFYRGYQWFRLRTIKQELLAENKQLKAQYLRLTARDVVLRKAKKLGLRPPEKKDFLNGALR
jgi:cell division protein FtsL